MVTATEPRGYRVSSLMETVVAGDYCIGCGACASLDDSPIAMQMDERGQYLPRLRADHVDAPNGFDPSLVCPFASLIDEDALAAERFADSPHVDARLGRYARAYAGFVRTGDHRSNGSSGGVTSWLLTRLVENGHVDGIVHVLPGETGRLFQYGVSTTVEGVAHGAKSRYYPVELSGALRLVRERPGRYAVVGVPCFVKAARLLAMHDTRYEASFKFFIALFCGHLKTPAFAESLAWQIGIPPNTLEDVDFRVKLPHLPANRYGFRATGGSGRDRVTVTRPVGELFGSNWGHGFFKPRACDYCDDVTGETADIAFGDAWLPGYVRDSGGTNVVVVRNELMGALIDEGIATGELALDPLGPEETVQSQAGNFRHRREGLAVRLAARERAGAWHPPKRVSAKEAGATDPKRKRIYELRERLSELSHVAFLEAKQRNDLTIFERTMAPHVRQYERLYDPSWKRLARRFLRALRLTRRV